jgi:amidohydrolase
MDWPAQEIDRLTELRRTLHRHPELSGEERRTAARMRDYLAELSPDRIIEGIGGHGLAAIYEGSGPGPTVLFRCELDALPIAETGRPAHRSTVDGKSHMCGHDGHMAMVTALAHHFARRRPETGRAVLLYQPAEETGAGARAVIADPKYAQLAPDFAFALHNMPGLPLGHVALQPGPVNCASRGMRIDLTGFTAHASEPEAGRSPAQALATLLQQIPGLGRQDSTGADFAMVTLTHARLGEPSFGVAPGEASLWLTLRTTLDDTMNALVARAEALAKQAGETSGLQVTIAYHDVFHHCENDAEATAVLERALDRTGTPRAAYTYPMRASEDFGLYGESARSAMFLLGSGENSPHLHHSDYDFPDELIARGAAVFAAAADELLGRRGAGK